MLGGELLSFSTEDCFSFLEPFIQIILLKIVLYIVILSSEYPCYAI